MMNRQSPLSALILWLSLIAVCPAQEPKAPAKPSEIKGAESAITVEDSLEAELSDRRWRDEAQAWLRKPTDVEFSETALEDVVRFLADLHKARIRIDRNALGVNVVTPITVSAMGQPLSHVLNRAMQSPELAWTVHRGDIVITSPKNLPLETRVFRVGRLLQLSAKRAPLQPSATAVGPSRFAPGPIQTELIEGVPFQLNMLLQEVIDAPWADTSGEGGSLSLFGELLVVRQSFQAQEQISRLLRVLEAALAREPGSPSLLVMSPDDAQRWLTAQKALRRELKLSLSETLLEDVVKMLAEQTEVEVFVDHPALEAAKIPATLITLNLPDGQYPADKAMQLALEPRQLLAVLDEGAIRITTAPRAAKFHQTVVYDVADLLRSEDDVPTLLSTLQESTSGQWKTRDGDGGTLTEFPGGLFVIRQSDSVHTQIALLLHELRQAKKDLPKEAAKPLPNDLETKFHKAKTKDEAEALERLILTFVSPNSWDVSGGKGLLRTAEDRLIIQQTRTVHEQIDQFLREYQQAKPITPTK